MEFLVSLVIFFYEIKAGNPAAIPKKSPFLWALAPSKWLLLLIINHLVLKHFNDEFNRRMLISLHDILRHSTLHFTRIRSNKFVRSLFRIAIETGDGNSRLLGGTVDAERSVCLLSHLLMEYEYQSGGFKFQCKYTQRCTLLGLKYVSSTAT